MTLEKSRKNIRSTRQRNAIHRAFEKTGRPLSPKEILEIAIHEVSGMGIATVYRNIRIMLDQHDLMTVEVPGQASRYFLAGRKKPIFLCTKTNRAFFIDPKCIRIEFNGLPTEFNPQHSEVVVFGEYCQKKADSCHTHCWD